VARPNQTETSIRTRAGIDAARQDTEILIADLEAELAGIAESTALVPDDEHDAEGSTVGYERARVTALLEAARHRRSELAAALVRVDEGEDRCAHCGLPIPAERRLALPATRTCVRCAGGRVSRSLGARPDPQPSATGLRAAGPSPH
jgi:DnaK suppressor protein